ncbi:LacI family DNA-binding transcriptional regulator [Paenarthrobacter sp. AB444]|uniref:LacI family DNA-binding transcriptional regulator n=1 Tax=Paenarthrobacter sp. AB444 TaxID=3025681 RepID=UPI002366D967|nr:LacI family DNA-binding transcriptional regulator [Paenarthrobacter sp. AB444]MDD7833882.1 LacI family DNA-binding transcriptional regulator [Paenarthrobacter sp. AB444]
MEGTNRPAKARRKRVTIVDVAKHAGVSTAAASKVLRNAYGASESMRQRVQASMDELGYRPSRPARGMRGRTFTLGMMVSDIDNPFFSILARGISSVIRPNSYELMITPAGYETGSQADAVDALIDHQMDGLILVAPILSEEHLERVAREIPLAIVGLHSQSPSLDSVSADDSLGSELVVDYLVGLGHRRIGFVARDRDDPDSSRPEMVRLAGFLDAMDRRHLLDEAVVVEGPWSQEGGKEAVRLIDAQDRPPTAVFAGADIVALGMISELWNQGRTVPDTYSLVGFDNSNASSFGPIDLTTVDQSGLEMGQQVARLLLERIGGRTSAVHTLMHPELIPRSTTASPRN